MWDSREGLRVLCGIWSLRLDPASRCEPTFHGPTVGRGLGKGMGLWVSGASWLPTRGLKPGVALSTAA